MKTFALSFLLFTIINFMGNAQNVEIPDTAFLYALIDKGVDTDKDSLISNVEAEAITSLFVNGDYGDLGNISDMTGIESFVNLEALGCHYNRITSLDISNNTALTYLYCSNNPLTSLNVSNNTALTVLYCSSNQLTTLDVSNNTSLIYFYCLNNLLTNLDVSNNIDLQRFYCHSNQLTSLDVSKNIDLSYFDCQSNQLTSLDVSHNIAISILNCKNNQLTSLDVTHNPELWNLACENNQLTSLDISNNTKLWSLDYKENQITNLDVTNNIELEYLDCSSNPLSSLDLSENVKLLNGYIYLSNMSTLYQVCVWELPFPPEDKVDKVRIDGSPNVYFTTDCTTGIKDNNWVSPIIYPNPVNDLLTIETCNPGLNLIEITSLNGQLIYSSSMNEPTHLIDLSSFQKGLYFITVRSRDFVRTEKIIKL